MQAYILHLLEENALSWAYNSEECRKMQCIKEIVYKNMQIGRTIYKAHVLGKVNTSLYVFVKIGKKKVCPFFGGKQMQT